MKKIIRLTESDLARLVKRVIIEQERDNEIGWNVILKGLANYGNPKKIITPEVQSLNWGMLKGSGYNWGLGIADNGSLPFQTTDEIQSKLFLNVIKEFGYNVGSYFKHTYQGKTRWGDSIKLDYSNPEKIIKMVKKLVDVLSGFKGHLH